MILVSKKTEGLKRTPPYINSSRMKLDHIGLDSFHRTLSKVVMSEMLTDP